MNRLYAAIGLVVWTVVLVGLAWAVAFEAIPYGLAKVAAYFAP
jgi:hypothetical protein